MLLQVGMLRDLPVASMMDEAKIATIADVVLHPDTGELIGFWAQPTGWFTGRKALSSRDILTYDPQAVIVRNADSLVDPEEIRPFQTAIKRSDGWLGKRVETEAGEAVGKVTDLIINTDLETLQKIQVASLFGPERLIARSDIVKVTPKAIIIANNAGTEVSGDVATQVAAS